MNKKLGKSLRLVIIILGVLGLLVYADVIPWSLLTFTQQYPEFSGWFIPWLIFLLVTAVPLYVILAVGIQVSKKIDSDNSFTSENVKSLKGVSLCLIIDAAYFLIGNIILWSLNMNYLGIVAASAILCAFVVCIAVAVKILAVLVEKAVEMREENESYI